MGATSRIREDGMHVGTGKHPMGNGEGAHAPDWGEWMSDMGWKVRQCRVHWCDRDQIARPADIDENGEVAEDKIR